MTRSTAKYLALLALATILFFWRTLLTNQFTIIIGSEGVNQNYAWFTFWVNSLRHGRVPLWDPYAFCGRPFAGEMLASAFYPVHLLFAALPLNLEGMLSPRLYHQMLALNHVLCAWLMFALLRELRLSRFASFIGACAFALSGMMVGMIWTTYLEAAIWLPAIFLFMLRAFRAGRTGRALVEGSLGGLCLGLSILTGGVHFVIMQGLFVITAAGYCAATADSPRRCWRRAAAVAAAVLLVGAAAAAVQLLPGYEYARLSLRYIDGGTFPATERIPYHRLHPGMWPQSVATTLFPTATAAGGEAWPAYIGVLPFFLAAGAVWRCWRMRWVPYLAAVAVLAFLYALANFTPVHGLSYVLVPFVWMVRQPSRFIYLTSFSLAVLAAIGLDSLLVRGGAVASWAPAQRLLRTVAIACAAALLIPAAFTQVSVNSWSNLSLLLILASCGLLTYLTAHDPKPRVRVLLALFVLFDLGAFCWVEANKAAPNKPYAEMERMISLRGPAEFVKSRPELARVRVNVAPDPEPNIGDIYGVQSAWGGGPSILVTHWRLSPMHDDLLNVRYVIKPASSPDPGPVYQDEHWKIYENPNAFPRAWIVHDVIVAKSEDAVYRRMDDSTTDLRNVAVVAAPLPQTLQQSTAGAEPVHFRAYEPDRLVLDVDARASGLVVLSEMYYPGWRAAVNGERAGIYSVDGGLRGILVRPGANRIVLEYRPLSVYAGGTLSIIAFAGVLIAAALAWRSDRRNRPVTGAAA